MDWIEGRISSTESDFGFIDGNVFFTQNACPGKEIPPLNTRVFYKCQPRRDLPMKQLATEIRISSKQYNCQDVPTPPGTPSPPPRDIPIQTIHLKHEPTIKSEPYDAHSDTYSRETSIYDRSRETRERTDSRDHIRSQSRDHSFDIKLERVTDTKPIVKLERRNSPNRNRSRSPIRRDRSGHFPPRREGNHRERNTNGNGYGHAKKKENRQKLKNFAPREQPRPKPNRNVSSEDSIHYPSIGSPEDKKGADSLAIMHEKFRILANRHKNELNSKSDWQAPEVTRRSRSMVLSGYQAEHDDENEDEDNELLIDEDEKGNGPSPDDLNQAMNDAETSNTIGSQALKEFRKDFEKAGLFKEKRFDRKDPKKSLLCEDYKKILNKAGELIRFIRTIKSHPDRIHSELWYNELKMANDGPLCRCEANQAIGINHGIYPGESKPLKLDKNANNLDQLYHYRIAIAPLTNFQFQDRDSTIILSNGKNFKFNGFSLFSPRRLSNIPSVPITRYHIDHTLFLLEEPPPTNFTITDLELFSDYFFNDTLEMYDWVSKNQIDGDAFFYFMPRFEYEVNRKIEVLGMDHVMEYFLSRNVPLIDYNDDTPLEYFLNCPEKEWERYISKFRGQLVTNPGKKPSTIRLDQLDREQTFSGKDNPETRYPTIVHFGVRPANLSYAGDPVYQKVFRTYQKLRHLITNKPRITPEHWQKISDLEVLLQKMRRMGDMQREICAEISCENFRQTGIFPDMAQYAFVLPVVTHHIRYHQCLENLQTILGYRFKNIQWLTRAMTHPSAVYNYGENPDQVRNSITNCGIRKPTYGAEGPTKPYEKKRGIVTLIKVMALLGSEEPKESPINYLERPEFLGDAVLGFICSTSLFFMFPELGEGALSMLRCALVSNAHLSVLAQKLKFNDYFVYVHAQDLARREDLNNALANCFEAVLGAMYMDGGLQVTREFLARTLFDDKELQNIWLNFPAHPLQVENPDGDRHLISKYNILEKMARFESEIGVEFKNIRLLAKAFTQRNVKFNEITKGHNQRLEFLGDSICGFLSAEYLFRHFPLHHEGHLTLLRCTMVGAPTQALVAQQLGMDNYIISRQQLTAEKMGWKQKILADLMEAFIAALFIDRGIVHVDVFMKTCFYPRLQHYIMQQVWNDPKSCLQQCCLTLRPEEGSPDLPEYKVVNNGSNSISKSRYKVTVFFRGEQIGEGHGTSIQQAEKHAARKALEKYYFPQREWQQYYIKHKMDNKGDKKLKKEKPIVPNWNPKKKELPPEKEAPKWSFESKNGENSNEWRPRIREGIWQSPYFIKLQKNENDKKGHPSTGSSSWNN